MNHFVTGPWRLLREPRARSALLAASYTAILTMIGIPTLLDVQDATLGSAHIGMGLAIASGAPLIAGGLLAGISQWSGTWFVERGGIHLILGGLLARAVIVMSITITPPTAIIALGELVAIGSLLATRLHAIRDLDLDPRKDLR